GVAVEEGHAIYTVNVASGEYREVYRLPEPPRAGFHLQWSHVNPSMLSFVGNVYRLMVLDIREGTAKAIYKEQTDENVTHEHWWVADAHGDDQMVFCGGTHPEPVEDAHVKVVNVQTGVVRVIGAGSWWPEGQDEEVAKRNFWHCSGDKLGHWVVADNWHGDITIFEGATTRPHLLTTGHRVYGRGVHPHVGWDRQSKRVIFTSHRLGNPNVCIATIPEAWQPKSR
ncbi:MAG: hypothetical protein KAH38_01430, partial [Candidatus Hydrogenedentes bacterium]|nr:hypothetical protein [Candidatus Hydrogenedentota bacterium]